ncbi:hypothetical protein Fcan01_05133 [Folsomia candida]|uniref:Uncharacterized protein n=1 Tax=Folsomia candida TaxID=158441 RepID=A0A226ESP7_FOLCA|nr:hypothetical protein Fcan01_05133 [Folsomia candida]
MLLNPMGLFVFVCICQPRGTMAKSIRIKVDTSQAVDLKHFGSNVVSILYDWFPYVESLLRSPTYQESPVTQFVIKFDPTYAGVAAAYPGKHPPLIRGSVNFYRKRKDDIGSMIHEMAHVIQKYKKCDFWITEGIADWVRYFHYERNRPVRPGRTKSYRDGYATSAYFLNWIESRYKGIIYYLNKSCREGTYTENIFERFTGYNVDQLWEIMQSI